MSTEHLYPTFPTQHLLPTALQFGDELLKRSPPAGPVLGHPLVHPVEILQVFQTIQQLVQGLVADEIAGRPWRVIITGSPSAASSSKREMFWRTSRTGSIVLVVTSSPPRRAFLRINCVHFSVSRPACQ